MKRLPIVVAISLILTGGLYAQDEFSEVEFMGFYQRVQGFDFNPSGVQGFNFEDEGMNAGGMGINYNLNPWFGIFTQVGFLGGVESQGLEMKIINEVQGAKVTKRDVGPANFYAKAGVGFVRYVFSQGGQEGVDYNMSLMYGGGTEIKFREGMSLVFDLSRLSIGLPQLTFDFEGRDKWDSSYVVTTGVLFSF